MEAMELERAMRERECFRSLRTLPGAWTVLRLDGRGFGRFTAERYGKPFDERLREQMASAAQALLEDFQGLYAVTHSDEISVLLPPQWERFNRRVEKLVSVSAGLVSAAFSQACGEPAHFDSRIWQGASLDEVIGYFRWRQIDAARCARHGWCYWSLRREGLDSAEATAALKDKDKTFQNALLSRHGIDYHRLPAWQRRGVGLYWETYEKPGYDPQRQVTVTASRRRIRRDLELPAGEAYAEWLRRLLA